MSRSRKRLYEEEELVWFFLVCVAEEGKYLLRIEGALFKKIPLQRLSQDGRDHDV